MSSPIGRKLPDGEGVSGLPTGVLMEVMVDLYDGEDEDGVLFHIVCARGQEERERGREGKRAREQGRVGLRMEAG